MQGGWKSSRTWWIKALNHRVNLVLIISKGVEKRGYLGVKVERRTDWEVDSCLTGFELKLQAEGTDKWKWVEDNGKSRRGLGWCIRAGEIDLEGISPSQGTSSHPSRGLTTTRITDVFSRDEKQEIRSGFQFWNLIKCQLLLSKYPYNTFSLGILWRIWSQFYCWCEADASEILL